MGSLLPLGSMDWVVVVGDIGRMDMERTCRRKKEEAVYCQWTRIEKLSLPRLFVCGLTSFHAWKAQDDQEPTKSFVGQVQSSIHTREDDHSASMNICLLTSPADKYHRSIQTISKESSTDHPAEHASWLAGSQPRAIEGLPNYRGVPRAFMHCMPPHHLCLQGEQAGRTDSNPN